MRPMPATEVELRYRNRSAARVENASLRVTVLREGGHIAEIFDKRAAVNPLWTPQWPSIEPSAYSRDAHPQFGSGSDAKLLAGIMGHNVCLDIFGGPSEEEAAAGLSAHGDAPVARYEIASSDNALTMRAYLPSAQLTFERRIDLADRTLRIRERVENLAAFDRPIGWTEHVTLGRPFLENGATEFRASAARSKVFDGEFGAHDYLASGAAFDWPLAPSASGGFVDLQRFTNASSSSAYTAHLMSEARETAFFVAYSPASRLAFGYVWKRADFPWLGIWEENASRAHSPWNGREVARGLEFGVSPFPESRRRMVERGSLFGAPVFRWLPARAAIEVEYYAMTLSVDRIPETLEWPS
jgi:hypothetical protein